MHCATAAPVELSVEYKIVNCLEDAPVLVALPVVPLQTVPGTYMNVLTSPGLVTDAAATVTVVGGVKKLMFAKAVTPVPAVVRSAAAAGNAPFLFAAHSLTAPA